MRCCSAQHVACDSESSFAALKPLVGQPPAARRLAARARRSAGLTGAHRDAVKRRQ
jgi:hypothetical protein